ncbi:Por secretion system C-terminal sorting domain-containing protein [Reichenbachiella faecimaris]|uniref:Por secretion system C-terminal sorting domain-containing protein n=1 Tax=Reichenbachiella faecimaris TaxID=692418 RepID=A0A1W2G5I0_REIFA|nr:S8 family peptidase [Reichenbachiella faecimaris]SMD31851.1 Por secretion system C-terminal sorting domain-containing protein [Reichenbachiella faecimaris]
MGKNRGRRLIFGLIMVCYSQMLLAQTETNRYVVYLKDKTNSPYSVDNPSAYLSQKAIDRRTNQNISITTEDFPVNESYVQSIRDLGVETYFTSRWMNAILVEATPDQIDLIEAEEYILHVDYAAPGQKLNEIPDQENTTREEHLPSNLDMLNSDKQVTMLFAHTMHEEGITGNGVWVAVFDDGFLDANLSATFAHTFENDKLKDVMDFTTGGKNVFQYDDHGTGSWSCLGAKLEPSFIGTGYNADISLYVTEDVFTEYRIEEYNWLFAAERADSAGVDIITSSLGYDDFDDPSMDYSVEDLDGNTSIISQAANFAIDRGLLVVTSAGNSGNSTDWPYISMPADAENVIAVGALDHSYNLVGFSSVGPTADGRIKPEVVALGSQVTVLSEGHLLALKNGTSFAAPLIAGFAAGLWEKFPSLTNLELRDLILSSSNNFASPNNQIGYGLPDYNVAVGNEPLAVAQVVDDAIKVYPNPITGDHINLLIEKHSIPMPLKMSLYSQSGKLINEMTIKRAKKGMIAELGFKENGQGIYFLHIECDNYSKNVKILRY